MRSARDVALVAEAMTALRDETKDVLRNELRAKVKRELTPGIS
jgi:hypothetical protein